MEGRPVNPVWAELVQLVPVVVLASSFLVAGEIDPSRAAPLFLVAAVLTVPVTAAVVARGHVLNPILVGTAVWLWAGAAAFGIPVPALSGPIAAAPGAGLFGCAFVVGLGALFHPAGYVGARHPDPAWVRKASLGLLALTLAAVAWAWVLRADLRLGNGLPFVAVNVARRVLIARAR